MPEIAYSDPEALVNNLYRGFLGRDADPAGLAHWVSEIANGASLDQAIEALLTSDEFRNRQSGAPLCYPPGHYYSPVVDPEQIREWFHSRREPGPHLPGVALDLDAMTTLWQCLLPYLTECPFPDEAQEGFRYYFQNSQYSYGDGSVLYAMLRFYRPRRVIEIGSGFSSACILDTAERHLVGNASLDFIEPFADRLRSVLGADLSRVTLHETPVQLVPLSLFDELAENDILFIDSTHVLKTGSDVCHELFEILPRLKPGVVIHFHDIGWPFEYQEEWVLRENRSWNEAYALRAFLTNNAEYEILFFNDYFRRFCRNVIVDRYPAFLNNTGGALWIRKRG